MDAVEQVERFVAGLGNNQWSCGAGSAILTADGLRAVLALAHRNEVDEALCEEIVQIVLDDCHEYYLPNVKDTVTKVRERLCR